MQNNQLQCSVQVKQMVPGLLEKQTWKLQNSTLKKK